MNTPPVSLTKREQDVLCLLSKGLQNKEIAQLLHIAEHTVEQHLRRIYQKFGVSNRTEAGIIWKQQQN